MTRRQWDRLAATLPKRAPRNDDHILHTLLRCFKRSRTR